MHSWKLLKVTPLLARSSIIIDKWGGIPHPPKQLLSFVSEETGQFSEVTDLDLKKQRRNRKLFLLQSRYLKAYQEKTISILLIVVPVEVYKSVKEFMDLIRDKVERRKLTLLGYYWQRDIGEIRFSLHYHFIIITSRISGEVLSLWLRGNDSAKYKIELCESLPAFVKYLSEKEIYAAYRGKSWGSSIKFKINVH